MNISAVDLFCGVGGLTHGVENAGIKVVAGLDIDETCKYAYEENNNAKFIKEDIKEVSSKKIKELFEKDKIKLLMGCAPCQPFSTYTKTESSKHSKWGLLDHFGRLVEDIQPEIVSMENVPALGSKSIFDDFVKILKDNDYNVFFQNVYSPKYGLPQTRSRLILLASKLGEIDLIPPKYTQDNYVTVRDAISNLPPLEAGEQHEEDFLHRASNLSKKNIERIKQSVPGGTWNDWDEELLCACHRKSSGQSYTAVYGRMEWDKPGPTITTQFYRYGTGRFGHPEQDRAITLREGAVLQSFPENYKFAPSKDRIIFDSIGRHIGNAVPVKLGEAIGESIIKHLEKYTN